MYSFGIILWCAQSPPCPHLRSVLTSLSLLGHNSETLLTVSFLPGRCREIVTGEAPVRGGRRDVR